MGTLGASFWIYAAPAALVWLVYFLRRHRREWAARERLAESEAARMLEPPSLHPVIDPELCSGCGNCADVCPEGDVLGLIDGKAVLVSPANCIGHGACKEACPMGAIELVFGTTTRGVEIPDVAPDFETSVPGVFIAGELGGMGLIRNAIEQGCQAVASIRSKRPRAVPPDLDLVIVGAGPAGLAATLAAHECGLRYRTIEQEAVGGAVAHYPRGKIVMTKPAKLPLYGRVRTGEISKESLLELWRDVQARTEIEIECGERLESLRRDGGALEVSTTRGKYRCQAVLLCIGRRGSPRKLEVPGEDLCKVVYRLGDPAEYRDRRVLVVGGGDSALEAAAAIAEEPGAIVALSYRGESFGRAKPKNRARIECAAACGTLDVLLGSRVLELTETHVRLDVAGRERTLANDAVIVCAGGILPNDLLRAAGIRFEMKHGTR